MSSSAVPVCAGPFISNIKIIEMMPQMPGCRDGAGQMTRNVPEIGSVSNWALANNSPRSEDAAAAACTYETNRKVGLSDAMPWAH